MGWASRILLPTDAKTLNPAKKGWKEIGAAAGKVGMWLCTAGLEVGPWGAGCSNRNFSQENAFARLWLGL